MSKEIYHSTQINNQESKKYRINHETIENNKNFAKKIVKTALLAGGILSSAYGLNKLTDGGSDAKTYDVDPSINAIEINSGANLRNDPVVENEADNNLVEKTEEPMVVNVDGNMYIKTDTNNGKWYGIPAENIKASDPSFDEKSDKDGIIWTNEQNVDEVIRDTDTV